MGIRRMNHAVLYVRDARRQQQFYTDVLGFSIVVDDPDGAFVFMRGARLATITTTSPSSRSAPRPAPSEAGSRTVGMYHIAWEVGSLDELEAMPAQRLAGRRRPRRRQRPWRQQEPLRQGSRRARVRGDVAGRPPSTGATRSTRPSSARSTSPPSSARSPDSPNAVTNRDGRVRTGHAHRRSPNRSALASPNGSLPASWHPGRRSRPSAR